MDRLLALFKPPPDAESVPDDQMMSIYKYWRMRQLYSTFIGYFVYYFVRVNIPVAMPLMEKDLGIGKSQLGLFLTLHAVVYGCSKFLNGILGDRSNPRYFMAFGLMMSAVMNVLFGCSSSLWTLGILWTINGWFQGMGFPPCARILSHWFGPKERGRFWSIWNTSHQVGGSAILVGAGFLAAHYGWRAAFLGPALVAMAVAVFLVDRLRDTPGSLGLPRVEVYTGEMAAGAGRRETLSPEAFKRFLSANVFRNPIVWLICAGNFFVYTIRYGFVNWAPSYLQQVKHMSPEASGAMVGGFELAGIVGSVLAGYLTDRFMKGRRAPICVVYMLLMGVSIAFFWKTPMGHPLNDSLALLATGFFCYGPQFLVGVIMADVATPQAAATAIGLTGFFGYFSQVVSGWGLGHLVETRGWDVSFELLILFSFIGAIPFALCWKVVPVEEEEITRKLALANAEPVHSSGNRIS